MHHNFKPGDWAIIVTSPTVKGEKNIGKVVKIIELIEEEIIQGMKFNVFVNGDNLICRDRFGDLIEGNLTEPSLCHTSRLMPLQDPDADYSNKVADELKRPAGVSA